MEENKCEYCNYEMENLFVLDLPLPAIYKNIIIETYVAAGELVADINGYRRDGKTMTRYCKINFCPVCGRKLTED